MWRRFKIGTFDHITPVRNTDHSHTLSIKLAHKHCHCLRCCLRTVLEQHVQMTTRCHRGDGCWNVSKPRHDTEHFIQLFHCFRKPRSAHHYLGVASVTPLSSLCSLILSWCSIHHVIVINPVGLTIILWTVMTNIIYITIWQITQQEWPWLRLRMITDTVHVLILKSHLFVKPVHFISEFNLMFLL